MGKTWEDGRWTTTIDFSLLCLFGFLFPSSSAAVTDEPRVEESARIPLPRIDGKTYVRSRFQHSPHFSHLSSVVTLTYMFDFLRYLFFFICAIHYFWVVPFLDERQRSLLFLLVQIVCSYVCTCNVLYQDIRIVHLSPISFSLSKLLP